MNTIIKTTICGLLTMLAVMFFISSGHAQMYSNYNNSMYIKGNAKVRDTLFVPGGSAVIGANTITLGAAFEVNSTNGGVLISRMDVIQRDAIAAPPTGLMIFNTTSGRFELYDGIEWKALLITGDVTGGSGSGAIWGDTIEGSVSHGNEIPYFSPSGKLISDSEFVKDSTSGAILMKADTQMLLINNDYWGGLPITGFVRSAYDYSAIAGFLDLSSYGGDSSELYLGYMDPITYARHAIIAQMKDSTIDIKSLKDIDIEAVSSIDINSKKIFIDSDTAMFIASDSVIFINAKSSFDINTQDDSDYSFGVSAFGYDAECCQNSTSLFKNYEPFNMTVDAFGIGDWGMHMKHTFNESSSTDYSANSIEINDNMVLIKANDSTFGEPAAFIRLTEWGSIDFGYGMTYYSFPSYNGSTGQVLTNDGTGALYWSNATAGAIIDTAINIISDSLLICNTRPQELLPAPGPGYYYDIISLIGKVYFNTTAYATNTSLIISCEGADYNWMQNTTLLPSTTTRTIKNWNEITPMDGSLTQITDNSRLMLSTFMGNPTDGDSDIIINIVYRKVPF